MTTPPLHHLATIATLVVALAGGATAVAAQVDSYRVGPKDLLEIEVFEAPEFDTTVRVTDHGTIVLPVIGEVPVEGLSEDALALRLKDRLEECCVQRASVSVEIKEFMSRPITVIGAVNDPGRLSFSGRSTLLEVLTAAGGLSSQAGDVIYVLRRAENGLSDQLEVRIEDLLVNGDRRVNVPIFANDLINVPQTVEVTIFFLGEVGRPGALSFKSTDSITLLTAIARVGGLTDRASKKITIKRKNADGELEEIEVDYKAMLAGRRPDVELEEGDLIVVKESFF